MIKFFEEFKKNKKRREALVNLYQETEKNLESCYVMQQRGVLEKFRLEAWRGLTPDCDIHFSVSVMDCVRAVEDYNAAMDDFKNYERWYAASLDNKTQENARILHGKKEAVEIKFKGMLGVVKPAVDALAQQLEELKIPKPKQR